MSKLAIVGGGSWGTALSIVLAPRFSEVLLWVHGPELAFSLGSLRENETYLPGFRLPRNVTPTSDLMVAVEMAGIVLMVTPSHHFRAVLTKMRPSIAPGSIVVSATKGLETKTLLRMSEVMAEILPTAKRTQFGIAALSGPTFAQEVARGDPAAVVIASNDIEIARLVQEAFSGPTFRLYTNTDMVGVELGAALKNVIAIAAGICHGLGLGSNTLAALVTRGLAEMSRLAIGLGGQPKTLAGLAGLGDLVLTCNGSLSRNRRVGIELAAGKTIAEIVGSTRMIAEGVQTTYAAAELARRHNIEMPIICTILDILQFGKSPRDAVRELMDRSLKAE